MGGRLGAGHDGVRDGWLKPGHDGLGVVIGGDYFCTARSAFALRRAKLSAGHSVLVS